MRILTAGNQNSGLVVLNEAVELHVGTAGSCNAEWYTLNVGIAM